MNRNIKHDRYIHILDLSMHILTINRYIDFFYMEQGPYI